MRQEVPFERWYFIHNTGTAGAIQGGFFGNRLSVLGSTLESGVRFLAEIVGYIFNKFFGSQADVTRHSDILGAQWASLKLSLYATLAPQRALESARNAAVPAAVATPAAAPATAATTAPAATPVVPSHPRVGCERADLSWGTEYSGTMTVNSWNLVTYTVPVRA